MPKTFVWLVCFSLLLLSAKPSLSQAQTRETKARNCSISGRVMIKGKPAINATVLVTSVEADQQQAMAIGQAEAVFAKAVTDGEGRYQIPNLPPGEMLVRTLSRAYVAKAGEQDFYARMSMGGKLVSLRSGDQREGVDFDFVRGGVITGRVTESGGRPLTNESVNLMKLDEEGKPQPTHFGSEWNERQTDDRGIYRLFGIPAGRYVVSAGAGNVPSIDSRQEFSRSKYVLRFYPDAAELAQAKVLEVTEGGELTDIDIRLKAGKGEERRTFAASGRVLDAETGKPVAQADLRAFSDTAGGHATTDAQGVFHMAGLPSGKYQLSYGEPNPFEQAVQPGYYADPVSFEIAEADANGLEVRLQRGATVSGVVAIEGQRTTPRDQPQTLAINARTVWHGARANSADGQLVMEPSNFAFSFVKTGGQFNLNGLRPGRVTFEVRELMATEANAAELRLVRIERNGANLGDDLEIGAKEQLTGVRVIVQRLAGVLRGQINFAGAALPKDWARHWSLNVALTAPGTVPPRITQDSVIPDPSGGDFKLGRIDETGRFEFRGLQAGSFVLFVIVSPVGQNVAAESPFEAAQQSVFINAQGETNVTVTVKVKAGGRQ
jgi:hypothetical protein